MLQLFIARRKLARFYRVDTSRKFTCTVHRRRTSVVAFMKRKKWNIFGNDS